MRSEMEDVRPRISSPGVIDLLLCLGLSVLSQSRPSKDSVEDRIVFLVGEEDWSKVGILVPEADVWSLEGGEMGSLEADGILLMAETLPGPGILLGVVLEPPDLVE